MAVYATESITEGTGYRIANTLSSHTLDFTQPFQARKWLRLLLEDPTSGIRIKPNLHLGPEALGFSFTSNAYGLRGPSSSIASAVVLGTSYAMGFAVDRGQDWFDGLLRPDEWFNAGLPVGPQEWTGLLDAYHRGERRLALFIYHPNIWPSAIAYTRWRSSGTGVFRHFGWRIGTWGCLRLHFRRVRSRAALLREGKRIIFTSHGQRFCLDSTYCNIRIAHCDLQAAAANLQKLLNSFNKIICVRVPIKEEFLPEHLRNTHFDHAKQCYEDMWAFTRRVVSMNPNAVLSELGGFEIQHYHGFDTHLNAHGNGYLRRHIHKLLVAEGFGSLCGRFTL